MNIQATKIELVKAILNIESDEIIQKLINFIKNEKLGFWEQLSDVEQLEIKKGIKDLDEGKRVSYEAFLKKIS